MATLYHHIYGFSMFNTLTKALCGIVSIIQIIPSFFVFNKPLEIPSYILLFSQCLQSGIVPSQTRSVHILQLIKVRYALDNPGNFRPISVVSVLAVYLFSCICSIICLKLIVAFVSMYICFVSMC